jgi:starch-binding outer membrane protein, SusD/RagB family
MLNNYHKKHLTMKPSFLTIISLAVITALSLVSCSKDLNREPANTTTSGIVFSTDTGAKEALAKVYGAYGLTSSTGSGNSDLGGIDAGTSDFIRMLFYAQEFTTDEAVCAWNDQGVPDLHNMSWTSADPILEGLYARIMYQVTVANSYIQQASKVSFTGQAATDLTHYVAEARFIRAFDYAEMMDLFGNSPFITDKEAIGTNPTYITRANLYNYVVSELRSLDSANSMVAARQNDFARADQACVWALLARVYLNAQVYSGTADWTDAITYSSKVIASGGYTLLQKYQNLFLADNGTSANTEQILSIAYDGNSSQNYGGTTFIINAEIGGSMSPSAYGVPGGGWGGNRVTSNIISLYPDLTGTVDRRSLFYTSGQTESIATIGTFNDGYPNVKFQNVTSTGATPAGASVYATTCFPLFRLAEQYLIYAEATLQGGSGGSQTLALQYFNALRQRAYGNNNGNVTSLTLQDILDERGRELVWECVRRTDLIRFGDFTSQSYLWPWKGGVASGTGVDSHYNIFPLSSTDVNANPNLTQNPGY